MEYKFKIKPFYIITVCEVTAKVTVRHNNWELFPSNISNVSNTFCGLETLQNNFQNIKHYFLWSNNIVLYEQQPNKIEFFVINKICLFKWNGNSKCTILWNMPYGNANEKGLVYVLSQINWLYNQDIKLLVKYTIWVRQVQFSKLFFYAFYMSKNHKNSAEQDV
jgi:hypothetical protein